MISLFQLHLVVEQKKTESTNLFIRCRLQICSFLAEVMHDVQTSQMERGDSEIPDTSHHGKTAEEILIEVSKVLGFENTKVFLTVSLNIICRD